MARRFVSVAQIRAVENVFIGTAQVACSDHSGLGRSSRSTEIDWFADEIFELEAEAEVMGCEASDEEDEEIEEESEIDRPRCEPVRRPKVVHKAPPRTQYRRVAKVRDVWPYIIWVLGDREFVDGYCFEEDPREYNRRIDNSKRRKCLRRERRLEVLRIKDAA